MIVYKNAYEKGFTQYILVEGYSVFLVKSHIS